MGVHLSFVRSVTMDKWKDVELEKMKVYSRLEENSLWSTMVSRMQEWTNRSPIIFPTVVSIPVTSPVESSVRYCLWTTSSMVVCLGTDLLTYLVLRL